MMDVFIRESDADFERFWSFVAVAGADECWEWIGGTAQGYGMFWIDGRTIRATRAYYYMNGIRLNSSEFVCHSCDNPRCVNPSHLWIGTSGDNMRDCYAKGRRSGKGESHASNKLTEDQVREIRSLSEQGYSRGMLARQYGVTRGNIIAIVQRKSWAHI